MGYELAIEKYPGLISREGLRVPSAYDSETETEEEEEEEQPGPSKASPYPIKIKWDRDSDGYWKLAKITTSTPKMKGKITRAVIVATEKELTESDLFTY